MVCNDEYESVSCLVSYFRPDPVCGFDVNNVGVAVQILSARVWKWPKQVLVKKGNLYPVVAWLEGEI